MENREMTKGNYVAYGTNGICEIEDVKPLSFTSGAEKSLYYILRPANSQGSTIFVPAGNETLTSRIRSLMTKDEIDALLTGMRDKELAWEQDRRFRTENFHEILMKGVQQELLLMIRCIYLKKQELEASGKKLPATDGNTLKAAEKLVEEEFSHVLHIAPGEVGEYIRSLLQVSD